MILTDYIADLSTHERCCPIGDDLYIVSKKTKRQNVNLGKGIMYLNVLFLNTSPCMLIIY